MPNKGFGEHKRHTCEKRLKQEDSNHHHNHEGNQGQAHLTNSLVKFSFATFVPTATRTQRGIKPSTERFMAVSLSLSCIFGLLHSLHKLPEETATANRRNHTDAHTTHNTAQG